MTSSPDHPQTGGFRRLAWSNLAAQSAEQVALASVPLIAVVALGAGPGSTGLLAAVQTLPFLLLSLPAGVLADRLAPQRLMAGAELMRAAALAAVPLLLWAGWLGLTALAMLGALTATGTVVYSVAAPGLVTSLVGRAQLAAANARLELARSLAFAGGPALAGLVVGLGGGLAFAIAAILSAGAALLLSGLPEQIREPAPRRRMTAELRAGWDFVAGHRLLRPIMATAVAWNMSWFILQAVFVPFAVERLGLGAAGIGLVMGAYGLGMVAGSLLAPWLGRRIPFGMLIATGPAISVAAAAALAVCAFAPTWQAAATALAIAGFFLFGFGPILWTIGQTTLRQAVTPAELIGQVSALTMMATAGARPIGAALGGLVGHAFGPEAAILLSACGFAVQFWLIGASPVPRLETLPEPPVRTAAGRFRMAR